MDVSFIQSQKTINAASSVKNIEVGYNRKSFFVLMDGKIHSVSDCNVDKRLRAAHKQGTMGSFLERHKVRVRENRDGEFVLGLDEGNGYSEPRRTATERGATDDFFIHIDRHNGSQEDDVLQKRSTR